MIEINFIELVCSGTMRQEKGPYRICTVIGLFVIAPWINSRHAQRKTDTNKQVGFFYRDYIGGIMDYPEGPAYADVKKGFYRGDH